MKRWRFGLFLVFFFTCSYTRQRIYNEGHRDHKHLRRSETPGGGVPIRLRLLRLLPMLLRRFPRHALPSLQPPVLPQLRRHRHHRLHLRKRRRGFPRLQDHATSASREPVQHHNGSGEERPEPELRHVDPAMHYLRQRECDRSDVSWPAVEGFFHDGDYGDGDWTGG